jgi:LemA protein
MNWKFVVAGVFGFMAFVAVTSCMWLVGVNNNMVGMQEGVNGQWSQVENVYQRRSDLIPNLVATVKGYATHESDVFIEVSKARASAGQIKVNAENAGDIAKYQQAQSGLSQALSRLMVISEKYPELKADKGFSELQSQLEGTENRITIERQKFNQVAQGYNTYIKRFPEVFIAGFRNFQPRPYFEAEANAKTVPKVSF